MGYAPKHAKPTSLKSVRTESRDGAFGIKESRGGRHRTGVTTATSIPPLRQSHEHSA
jgi:hypothetical protein